VDRSPPHKTTVQNLVKLAVTELEEPETDADMEGITQNGREGSENVMGQRRKRDRKLKILIWSPAIYFALNQHSF